jgi:cobalamin biosynthesis Mg chelatase CobN
MTEVDCPAEGCDRRGDLEGVKNHINAMSDDAHADVERLRSEAEAAAEATETDPEAPAPDDDGEDDREEATESERQQRDKPTDEPPAEATEATARSDMADESEVQAQWESDETDRQQRDDGSTEADQEATGSDRQAGAPAVGLPVPVDTTTIMWAVVALALVALVWQFARSGSDGANDRPEATETDRQQRDEPTDQPTASAGSEEVTLFDE